MLKTLRQHRTLRPHRTLRQHRCALLASGAVVTVAAGLALAPRPADAGDVCGLAGTYAVSGGNVTVPGAPASTSIGTAAIACGNSASAGGSQSVAVGRFASAPGDLSVA